MTERIKMTLRQQKENARRGQKRDSIEQADQNYNAKRDEKCEEIGSANADEQSVFSPLAEEEQYDNKKQMLEEISVECRPRSVHRTDEEDCDGSVSSVHDGCPPEKKKVQRSLFGNDVETESTCDQPVFAQGLPRNDRSQPEQIVSDDEWLEALRLRLNKIKQEQNGALEESEEKKEWRRQIREALEMVQDDRTAAKRVLEGKGSYSEEDIDWIFEDLYAIKNEYIITFAQKMAGRMVDGNRWKRTDVGLRTSGISRSYEAKEPPKITGRNPADECRHQSSVSNTPLISRPSKEKYSYLPHFREELGSFTAGCYGNSEEVEGFLVGGREKLQEIRRELSFHSRPRSPDKIHDNENIVNDRSVSSLGDRGPNEIHEKIGLVIDNSISFPNEIDEKEVTVTSHAVSSLAAESCGDCCESGCDCCYCAPDTTPEKEGNGGSVSCPDNSPFAEKKKLCSLWGVDIYEEDFDNSPEDVKPSKELLGSTADQDV